MADDPKVEEVKEGEEKESKGGSPWIPLAVVIILLPILSYVITDFVLIPKIKKSVHQAISGADAQATPGHDAHASAKDSHGKEVKKDGKTTSYEFKDIVANLAGTMQSRYIKVSFIVESPHPDFATLMIENQIKIKDATLTMLSSLSINDLEKPGVQGIVRNDLLTAFANVLKSDVITQLYFSEFVVQ